MVINPSHLLTLMTVVYYNYNLGRFVLAINLTLSY